MGFIKHFKDDTTPMWEKVEVDKKHYICNMGATKLFKTPWELWDYFEKYKKHCIENPIKETLWVGKDAREVDKKTEQPLTWKGFESFLFTQNIHKIKNKSSQEIDLDRYRRNVDDAYSDYIGIIRAIGAYMFNQKYSRAVCNIYNQNIVAKEIGLIDKQEITNFQRPILEGGKELPSDD